MSLEISLAGRVTIGSEGVLIEEERLPGRQGPGRRQPCPGRFRSGVCPGDAERGCL